VFFSRGRYALRAALRALAFGPGDQLLVPSYHCRTMLDPALDLGGHVAFYPLMPSLALRMDVLERIVQGGGASFKALLYPHYFGFPQSLTEVAAFCRQQGIA
jgi:dTDP-4-amino-4,6-dideoxygalactose transaminase